MLLLWIASAGVQVSGRRSVLKFAAAGLSATGAGVQWAAGAEGLQQAADAYQNFDRALVAKQKEVAAPLVDAKQRGDARIAEQGEKFSATMEKLNNCQVFRPVGDGGGCALTNGQQVFAFRDVLCHNCEGALGAGPKERAASLTLPLTLTLTLTLMMKERRPEGLLTLALTLALANPSPSPNPSPSRKPSPIPNPDEGAEGVALRLHGGRQVLPRGREA